MSDLRSFWHAATVFLHNLSAVRPLPMAVGIGLLVANLLLRSRAWYSILRAAYPGTPGLPWRSCAGAYLSGVGVNAVAPARGGDLVKVYLVRVRLRDSNAATLFSTLIVETLFDVVVGSCMLVYAYHLNVLPSLPSLPSLPAFEWSAAASHARIAGFVAGVLVVLLAIALRRAIHAVRDFWGRVRQGFAILKTPKRWLATVIFPQALGWGCRLGAMYAFLRAFHLQASVPNAILVLVVGSIATLLPFTPGGAGTQQALIVYVLAGAGTGSQLLAFSVGMQVAQTGVAIVMGFSALALMLKSLSLRQGIRRIHESEADHAAAARAAPPPPQVKVGS
jgi:uncharacterized membrane protein YbhN (UPF0104 family)